MFGQSLIPWAGVIFLAGGMKTVLRLTLQKLVSGLPLALLAVLFGAVAIWRARRTKARIMASARTANGKWLHNYGNFEVSDAKRLRPTEEENPMVRSSLQIEAWN